MYFRSVFSQCICKEDLILHIICEHNQFGEPKIGRSRDVCCGVCYFKMYTTNSIKNFKYGNYFSLLKMRKEIARDEEKSAPRKRTRIKQKFI